VCNAVTVLRGARLQVNAEAFKLSEITQKLSDLVRKDVTVDWRVKGQARDRIPAKVRFLLKLYHYPPDQEPEAIERVLKQTEVKAEEWA
jgi:type I restriction enzyme R subunit